MDRRDTKMAVQTALFGPILTFIGGVLFGKLTTNNGIGIPPIFDIIIAIVCTLFGLGLIIGSIRWFVRHLPVG